MKEKLVSIKNLSAGTKYKQILNNISFDIYAGEILCLLGQSGSGKTMTASAILNILPENIMQTSGQILYGTEKFHKGIYGSYIGSIMQNPAACFDNVFTMEEQIKDILKANNKDYSQEKMCNILEKVSLTNQQDILNSYPYQLSGGMLQRVMIAVALSLESRVIIADEPTSDLDVLGQREILDLIVKLKNENNAVLMITHNLSVVKHMADRIIVMENGSIVDDFNKDELHNNKRHPYTQKLIKANESQYINKWNISFGEYNAKM